MRDVRSVQDLMKPGDVTFFRLKGPFYASKSMIGRHVSYSMDEGRDGARHHTRNLLLRLPAAGRCV